ncbi:MAG: hypothetical protein KDD89_17095, partial [Anaerolineales bacterium]|nr:hypothetical protein [Anaerolineales bacterium]
MRAGVEEGDGSRANYSWLARLAIVLIFTYQGMLSIQAYFFDWATAPEVRLHYETALVETLGYLNENGQGVVTLSTQTPDRYHSPAVGLLALNNPAVSLRWFNGTRSLLLPDVPAHTLTFSGQSALAPELAAWLDGATSGETTLPLLETDLDRPVTVKQVNTAVLSDTLAKQFTGQLAPGLITEKNEQNLLRINNVQ